MRSSTFLQSVDGDETAATPVVSAGVLAGGEPFVLTDQQNAPHGLAVDGEHVYWSSALDETVLRIEKSAGRAD